MSPPPLAFGIDCRATWKPHRSPLRHPRAKASDVVREFLSRYGLIALLLALPVYYGIQDLSDDGNLSRLGNNLMDGLSNGAIWALVALGYTLVYGIIELINFAHGEIFMIGAFTSFALYGHARAHPETGTASGSSAGLLVTLVVAMFVSGSLNVMIERVGYRPLRQAPKLAPLITAVGFSFILQNVGILWLGASQRGVPDLINSQKELVNIVGRLDLARRPAGDRGHDPAGDSCSPRSCRAAASARRCAPPRRTRRRRG